MLLHYLHSLHLCLCKVFSICNISFFQIFWKVSFKLLIYMVG
jgi:hypothetical protein